MLPGAAWPGLPTLLLSISSDRFAPTEVRDVKAIKAKALESISKELLRAAVMKGHTS